MFVLTSPPEDRRSHGAHVSLGPRRDDQGESLGIGLTLSSVWMIIARRAQMRSRIRQVSARMAKKSVSSRPRAPRKVSPCGERRGHLIGVGHARLRGFHSI